MRFEYGEIRNTKKLLAIDFLPLLFAFYFVLTVLFNLKLLAIKCTYAILVLNLTPSIEYTSK